ncbi:MAG: hypothetical protein KDH20_00425 [Rhodocyclaceae bacterium]|nr:hypothetical protein [Rhodocyclaceae bacterium]
MAFIDRRWIARGNPNGGRGQRASRKHYGQDHGGTKDDGKDHVLTDPLGLSPVQVECSADHASEHASREFADCAGDGFEEIHLMPGGDGAVDCEGVQLSTKVFIRPEPPNDFL